MRWTVRCQFTRLEKPIAGVFPACCDSGGEDADMAAGAASHISSRYGLITERPDHLSSVSQHPNTLRCLLTVFTRVLQ